jgi:hypothetical protein
MALLSGWQRHKVEDESGRAWRVSLRPTVSGGHYIYSEVRVESLEYPPEQVTLAALRSIGLPGLMRKDEEQRRDTLERLKPHRKGAATELHAVRAARLGGYRDEHWKAVLQVHRKAQSRGEPPTKAVQRYLEDVFGRDVPYGTAGRHVARAKDWERKGKGGQ